VALLALAEDVAAVATQRTASDRQTQAIPELGLNRPMLGIVEMRRLRTHYIA